MGEPQVALRNLNLVNLVADRIKSQPIGDLIKEEDLYGVVKDAMNKVFNTKVKIPRKNTGSSDSSSAEYVDGPYSIIEQAIVDYTKESVTSIIKDFFLSREDEFKQLFLDRVDETIKQISVEFLTKALIKNFIQTPLTKMQEDMTASIAEAMNKNKLNF